MFILRWLSFIEKVRDGFVLGIVRGAEWYVYRSNPIVNNVWAKYSFLLFFCISKEWVYKIYTLTKCQN